TNRRVPVESAKRGKFSVALQAFGKVGLPLVSVPVAVAQRTGVCLPVVVSVLNALFGTELFRSGCPIAASAGAALLEGIVFHIRTRLYPRSATNSRTPSEVTDTGFSMLAAEASVFCCVRSGC